MSTSLLNLHRRINGMGWREQDRALNFPNLYLCGHCLTRAFAGNAKQFERNLKKGKYE